MAKKKPEAYSRPAWERMMRMHQLIQNGEYPNCPKVAKEFEVSTRTVKRDVEFMKVRLKLPIEYDENRYGFFYTQPVDQFPTVAVTEAELFSLLVAHKAIAQYHGTPFQAPLEAAFRKLTGQLDQSAKFTLSNLDGMVSFRPLAPEDTDLATFQTIARAVQERRALRFVYRNLGATKAQRRHVRPYHLACIENHWYLFAFDIERAAMRTFVLTRLREAELTKEKFTIPQKFSASEYLRSSFSAYKGAQDYEIVMDFDAWAADLIRGRKWHPSQQIQELPGGAMRFSMRLDSLEEADRWVLSWGTHATVVRPKALVDRLRSAAGTLADRYRE
jgi:predicted DNA-binding transcriptional regulator YafY